MKNLQKKHNFLSKKIRSGNFFKIVTVKNDKKEIPTSERSILQRGKYLLDMCQHER